MVSKTTSQLKEPKLMSPKSFGKRVAAISTAITKTDKEGEMTKETGVSY